MTIFVADCNRCGADQITFDVIGVSKIGTIGHAIGVFELFVNCRFCKRGNVIQAQHKSYDIARSSPDHTLMNAQSLNGSLVFNEFLNLKHLHVVEVPEFLEGPLLEAFKEGATCASVGCHNAAAMTFRLCVDLLTRPLLPDASDNTQVQPNSKQRKDVAPRLAWLFEHGRLPENLKDLADCVRDDGNDAAHHGEINTPEESADLGDFTRILIERLITEPRRLESARQRRIDRRAERPD